MLEFSATFAITLVNFGILYFVLRALLFKPVTRFMENRSLKIRNDLEHATREKARADELRAAYEDQLRKMEDEGERIIREARTVAQEQADQIVARGRAEAARIVDAARSRSEAERRAAAVAFKAEAAGLVLAATGRLLRRDATDDDSRRAAAALVAELGGR